VRDTLDYGVFIDLDEEESLRRRVKRDISERHRTRESVISQYRLTVQPMYETHVAHTKKYADLVLDGKQTAADSVSTILRNIPRGLPPQRE
jgi:uridine kinase